MNVYRTNTYIAPPPEKVSLKVRITKRVAALGIAGVMTALATGCPQAQSAQAIMQPAEACIVNNLFLNGGLQNPMAVVVACAGVTIADVIQVIEMLLSQPSDASVVADGGALGVSVQAGGSVHVVSRVDLEQALVKARMAKASMAVDAAAH